MTQGDYQDEQDSTPDYAQPNLVSSSALAASLDRLPMLGDDVYLRMQAFNVSVVDHLLMQTEHEALQTQFRNDRVRGDCLVMLSALTPMWFFSAYELLRTWRARCRDLITWADNGGLALKLKAYAQDEGFTDFGKEVRAEQVERVMNDPLLVEALRGALDVTHYTFTRLEHIRIALAKHEVANSKGAPAHSPGYGRMNRWCGSLEYELVRDGVTYDVVCRRDIADALRSTDTSNRPSKEELSSFNAFMKGRRNGAGLWD
jgi:hypothetical protein